MKADSAVFKNIQFPMTIFGISLKLFILIFVVSLVFFALFLVINLIQFALIFSVIFIAVSWVTVFRKIQKNPHFTNYLLKSRQFWQGRDFVVLVSGTPPSQSKGGHT
ncbi:MAG: hypothetical protein JKY17_08580 [Magnetovibrio sp.]|nr:hypothetical protein [Magnetovibrio sp.]